MVGLVHARRQEKIDREIVEATDMRFYINHFEVTCACQND